MAGDLEVVEEAALERLIRIGGQDFLVEMIDLFLEHAPERLRLARASLETGDIQGLYRAAHSLKSTAGNLGARALQDVSERAEGRAAVEDLVAMPPLLDEMDARYSEVRKRLEAERKRRTGS